MIKKLAFIMIIQDVLYMIQILALIFIIQSVLYAVEYKLQAGRSRVRDPME
jgi:hypothetical protein